MYGDAMVMSFWEAQIAAGNQQKRLIFRLFLEMGELIAWGTHKDKS